MSDFITYEKFATAAELKEFVEWLQANGIPYELEDDVQLFDASFANIRHHRDYRIKLRPEDFDRVNELRNSLAEVELNEIAPDYYLFGFTNEELIDLISKQDEWSPFDFRLAQKILKDRGREITSKEINELKDKRIKELSLPEKDDKSWVVIGYILAFIFPFFAIIMGVYMLSNRKTLPNGKRVYTFSESTRSQGTIILLIGAVLFILIVVLRLNSAYRFLS